MPAARSGSSRSSAENDRCSLLGKAFACCIVSWLLIGLKAELGRPVERPNLRGIARELEAKDLLDETM
eukprot:2322060-Pyramimonas_sp.AAC.1